jgi:hypothetical protein
MSLSNAGNKPIFDPKTGEVLGPECRSIMLDPRLQPTLREQLQLGVGKAHRQVVYSHYEYRNFKRSYLGETGRLP